MDLTVILGVAILSVYTLIKDVLVPTVRKALKTGKEIPVIPSEPSRLAVLEVNLSAVTAQVVQFDKLLQETSISHDNKLDLVLAELKELREEHAAAHQQLTERIAKAETHIEHLLQRTSRAGH